MPDIAPSRWHEELAAHVAGGYAFLDVLTVVDRGEQYEVIARVVDVRSAAARLLTTRVAAESAEVASAVDLYPGAGWHEREAAEMFGIRFIGHPDLRPLVTDGQGQPLLRKTTPLPARVQTPWPGADESSRRRTRVPGVRDDWSADAS